jgi:hypothetical protein
MEIIMKTCLTRIIEPNTIIFFTDIRVQLPLKVLEHVRKVRVHLCNAKTRFLLHYFARRAKDKVENGRL